MGVKVQLLDSNCIFTKSLAARLSLAERKRAAHAEPPAVISITGQCLCVPLSVVMTTMVLSSAPMSLSFHDRTDDVIELGHAGFLLRPAILRVTQRFVFRREMRDDVHTRRIEPDEKRLAVAFRFVHEI